MITYNPPNKEEHLDWFDYESWSFVGETAHSTLFFTVVEISSIRKKLVVEHGDEVSFNKAVASKLHKLVKVIFSGIEIEIRE
jgi:hypothetical protein